MLNITNKFPPDPFFNISLFLALERRDFYINLFYHIYLNINIKISNPRPPPATPTETPDQLQQIGKAVEQFLSGGQPNGNDIQLPSGFNQGFSFNGGANKNNLAFQENSNPVVRLNFLNFGT